MVKDISEHGTQFHLKNTNFRLNSRGITKYKDKPLPEGTILMPSSGAAILKNHRAILGKESYISTTIVGIIPNKTKICPYYLFYYLLYFDMKVIVYDQGYPGLRSKDIEKIPIYTNDQELTKKANLYVQQMIECHKHQQEIYKDMKGLRKSMPTIQF